MGPPLKWSEPDPSTSCLEITRRRPMTDDTITAVSGTNGDGFVAIDDVLISEQCNQRTRSTQRFDCGNKTVTIERVCDFVTDCENGEDERNCGDCDFSKGLCGWISDGSLNRGTAAWRRKAVGEVENSPLTNPRNSRNGECSWK
ncbi:hypothetical protein HPB49_019857 [Dermacentor silvarum]|uniref:Uncharacterized protein n=1 Tax=Dermacentor silvarum TaxID=543639 RepID=A0ACB8CZW7_DERSI|nr:hypothetical protein HPB49_019857 [Dermacentor silvarum]